MTRTQVLQEIRRMRFREASGDGGNGGSVAGGVCAALDRRPGRAGRVGLGTARPSTRWCAPRRFDGWNVHFYSFYRRHHAGTRLHLGEEHVAARGWFGAGQAPAPARARAARGDVLHQDGSTHQWAPGQHWDLIITLDDATSKHYSFRRGAPHRFGAGHREPGAALEPVYRPRLATGTTPEARSTETTRAVRARDAPARRRDDSRASPEARGR